MRFVLPPLPSPWPARHKALLKGTLMGAAGIGLTVAAYTVPAMLLAFLGMAIALDRVKAAHLKAALLWTAFVASLAAINSLGMTVLMRCLTPPGLILAAVAAYQLIYSTHTKERT